jgi:Carbohydrate esterase, sialic acid-specific acetylesterase
MASANEHAHEPPLIPNSGCRPGPDSVSSLAALIPSFQHPTGQSLRRLGCRSSSRKNLEVVEDLSFLSNAVDERQSPLDYTVETKPQLEQLPQLRRPTRSRNGLSRGRFIRLDLPAMHSSTTEPTPTLETKEPAFSPLTALLPLVPSQMPAAGVSDAPSQVPSAVVSTPSPSLSPLPLLQRPLKVFVVAGQSNAQGKGSILHLDKLIERPCERGCNEFRRALWNETSSSYNVNRDVFEKYLPYHNGPLSVHDNLMDETTNDTEYHTFGPDLMFGWTVQERLNETIAIIKTAWGGKSLAVDFRPPSSGIGNFSGVDPSRYGAHYRKMVDEILASLSEIRSWVPSYNVELGYVLSGFVWFQGYNDLINQDMCDEYGSNLANLIRDIRFSLDAPELPFVVGELGMHGTDERFMPEFAMSRIMKIRSSQLLVTKMDEFIGNTIFASTSQYAILDGDKWSGVYHYCGRADTFFHIGQEFGRSMLPLLGYPNITESVECTCDAVDSPTHS